MDLKTWAMRLGTIAVAVGIYVLAELVLKDTGAYAPVLALAGVVGGLVLPQIARGGAVVLALVLLLPVMSGCATVKPVLRGVNDAAVLLCESAFGVDERAAASGLTVRDFCQLHHVLDPFIQEATRAQRVAAGRAGLPAPRAP